MDHQCIQEQRIRDLEMGQTETKVYVKLIREDIGEIKATLETLTKAKQPEGSFLQSIVMELIKVITQLVTVVGGVMAALKIVGKG